MQVHVDLPGVSHRAMQVDGGLEYVDRRAGPPTARSTADSRRCAGVLDDRECGVLDQRPRLLGQRVHVSELVLDGLKTADRSPELRPRGDEFDRVGEYLLHPS